MSSLKDKYGYFENTDPRINNIVKRRQRIGSVQINDTYLMLDIWTTRNLYTLVKIFDKNYNCIMGIEDTSQAYLCNDYVLYSRICDNNDTNIYTYDIKLKEHKFIFTLPNDKSYPNFDYYISFNEYNLIVYIYYKYRNKYVLVEIKGKEIIKTKDIDLNGYEPSRLELISSKTSNLCYLYMDDYICLIDDKVERIYKLDNRGYLGYYAYFDIDYYDNILSSNLLKNGLEVHSDTDNYIIKLNILKFILYKNKLIYVDSSNKIIIIEFPNLYPKIK